MSRSWFRSFIPVLLLGLATLGLSACDISNPLEDVDLALDVEDASVNMGSVTTAVQPDRPSSKTEEVNPDVDVKEVRDIRSIRLKPEFFAFDAGGNSQSKSVAGALGSGTLEVWVFFGSPQFPLPGMPITLTITDDQVTNVSPSTINVGGETYDVDREGLQQLLDDLEQDAPSLGDWENASGDDVETAIKKALQSDRASISVSVEVVEGNLSGSLTVDRFSIDAQVTK